MTNCKECGQPIIKDVDYKNDVAKAIMYLNKVVGSKFKPVPANAKHIIARLKEGHTLKDLQRVIDSKSAQWKGTDQAQYLRPATLFNATKFNQYVGQVDVPLKPVDPRSYQPKFVDEIEAVETPRADDATAFKKLAEMRGKLK